MGKVTVVGGNIGMNAPKIKLPSGYTELTYIASTGTQYIDTGFKPNQDTKVVMDVQSVGVNTADTGQSFFGARNGTAYRFFAFWHRTNAAYYIYYNNTSANTASDRLTSRMTVTMDKNNLDVGGSVSVSTNYAEFACEQNMFLFATNMDGTADYFGVNRVYSCQIYDNGVLVRNFVPCVNPNGENGLYDHVNKKFYGNSGTGSFIGVSESDDKILACELSVGSSVYLTENNSPVEYLVINHGIPSNSSIYDSSCDGTWLLRKDIYEKRAWHSSKNSNYSGSTIHSYLNSTFFGLFDSTTQSAIKEIKIPYGQGQSSSTVYTDSSGLSTKVFLLSAREITDYESEQYPNEGAKVECFNDDSQLIAYLNGTATAWWLRSPYAGVSGQAWYVETNGGHYLSQYCTSSYGIRPALVIPSTAVFDINTLLLKGVS